MSEYDYERHEDTNTDVIDVSFCMLVRDLPALEQILRTGLSRICDEATSEDEARKAAGLYKTVQDAIDRGVADLRRQKEETDDVQ